MTHSQLPWRITAPEERKGREIVDARGSTVAKLTTLDMENAALIVKSVNAKCAVPPVGWECTRAGGHDGPCAAVPMQNHDGVLGSAQLSVLVDMYRKGEPLEDLFQLAVEFGQQAS